MRILIFSLIVCCSGSGFSLSLQENGKWNLVDMGHLETLYPRVWQRHIHVLMKIYLTKSDTKSYTYNVAMSQFNCTYPFR